MIRSSQFYWGGILIVLGGLFLVNSLGIFTINLWSVFWPVILILVGIWFLVGYNLRPGPMRIEEAAIPLEGAQSASLHLHHGAGKLVIGSGTGPMDLVSGSFGGGLKFQTRNLEDDVKITMRVGESGFPLLIFPWFLGSKNHLDWDLKLTDEIPINLKLNTGAGESHLDLTDLQVKNLRVETGASATDIFLPDSVNFSKVVIKAGAASVNIKVPDVVAAKIRISGGLMGSNVDQDQFPKSGYFYQSEDYENAVHKTEIRVEIGAGSVTVM